MYRHQVADMHFGHVGTLLQAFSMPLFPNPVRVRPASKSQDERYYCFKQSRTERQENATHSYHVLDPFVVIRHRRAVLLAPGSWAMSVSRKGL
jgi:hypothetical protein